MALEIYGSQRVGPNQSGTIDSVTVVTALVGHMSNSLPIRTGMSSVKPTGASDRAEAHDYIPGVYDVLVELVATE